MAQPIELIFPGLQGTAYRVTSPPADNYNCIAWAAGDTAAWWWPDEPDQPVSAFWPPGVPRVETMDAFVKAFEALGYVASSDERLEGGYEKIALFALAGAPRHAARQLPNGRWTRLCPWPIYA
jgi:hypothetical protein